MSKRPGIVVILCLCCLSFQAVAQPAAITTSQETTAGPASEELIRQYGLAGGLNLNQHNADFGGLPGSPSCCPGYESGSGIGPSIELLVDLPLSSLFGLQLRAGFGLQNAELTDTETQPVLDAGQNLSVNGTIEHSIDASLAQLYFSALMGMRLAEPLTILAGASLGLPTSQSIVQQERLLSPAGGVFENGRRLRNELSGDVPDAADVLAFLRLGASYELPLDRSNEWRLAPEFSFAFALNSLVEGIDWRPHALTLGLSLRYAPEKAETPVISPPPPIHVPTDKPFLLAVDITALGLDDDGSEREDLLVTVEEQTSSHFQPLLPFVFFDADDDALLLRYASLDAEASANFSIRDLRSNNILETYYQVLNIVGKRMRQDSGARLLVTGCNAGPSEEPQGLDLSRRRAEAVHRYLNRVWAIDEQRIDIGIRDLPANASSGETPEGVAENRRVELYSASPAILQPVIISDTIRVASPPSIRFLPSVTADAGVADWTIFLRQPGGTLNQRISGSGKTDGTATDLALTSIASLLRDKPLEYYLEARDTRGQVATSAVKQLPLRYLTIQRSLAERREGRTHERYTVLFPYRSAAIDEINNFNISYIADRIDADAEVRLLGYSDSLGLADYNRRLSQDRAERVAAMLGLGAEHSRGLGETTQLFDNALPEGRFYSRTVEVYIIREGTDVAPD